MSNTDLKLTTPIEKLEKDILKEDNIDSLNDLVDIFNVNLRKKDIIRNNKLSEVQDKVVDQMTERVTKKADEFSNADLLNYHKVIQDTISKTNSTLDGIKTPNIHIEQINLNEEDKFDSASRKRILSAVNAILKSTQETTEESSDVIDVDEKDILTEEECEVLNNGADDSK